jgi:hypothetical protein
VYNAKSQIAWYIFMKSGNKVTTKLRCFERDKLSMTDVASLTNISKGVGAPATFTGISKHFYRLYQPQHLINALLTAVAQGNQNKVERMPHLNLLLEKGDVTDYSGRQFKQITAYQYALWALDRRMVKAIEQMAYKASGSEGTDLRAALLKQKTELKDMGLFYSLGGVNYCETQYHYKSLIDSYWIFSESWLQLDYSISYIAWQNVAKQQRLMPAHVVQELCNPSFSIDPIPKFKEHKKARFSGYINPLNRYVNVFPWEQGLSPDYLLVKDSSSPGMGKFIIEKLMGNTNSPLPGVSILWIATLMMSPKPNLHYRELFLQNGTALKTLLDLRIEELKPDPELCPSAPGCVLS